jgi:molybdate transport system substrate-binding protein
MQSSPKALAKMRDRESRMRLQSLRVTALQTGAAKATMRGVIAAVVLFAASSAALAGDIRVLAAVAVKAPLDRFVAAFTKATGHSVDVSYSLTGPILAEIKAGKPVDAVVLPDAGRKALEKAGLSASQAPVSSSLAGVGVPDTASLPDISSLEKFKAFLHAVPSVAYTDPKSGGAFGQSFDRTLVQLGLAEEVRRKALLVKGSQKIVEAVAQGKAAAGISFKSAIVSTPGLKFAGKLPAPFDNEEPFTAIVLKGSHSPDVARAFVASLTTPEARAIWERLGYITAGAAAH